MAGLQTVQQYLQRKKQQESEGLGLIERYNQFLSKPWVASYRLLGKRLARILPLFEDLRPSLLKSGRKISFEAYVSLVFLTAGIAFACGTGVSLVIGLVFGANPLPMLLLGFAFGLLASAVTFGVTYAYPSVAADGRKRQLDEELSYSISHMAILASAGLQPERVIRSLAASDPKSVIAEESKMIVRDIDLLGQDLLSAMVAARERSPSKSFADFLEGFIATTRSGGDLKKYLLSSAKDLMELRRIMGKQLVDTLGMLSEVYVSMLVVFPLILLIMFSVMGLVGGNIGGFGVFGIIALVTYALIPLLAIMVLVMLDGMLPKR